MPKAQLQIFLALHDLFSPREVGDHIRFKIHRNCFTPLKYENQVSRDKMLVEIWTIRQNTWHGPDEIRKIWQEPLTNP